MYCLYDLLHYKAAKNKFLEAKEDPDKRVSCISYAIMSIVCSIIAVAAAFGIKWAETLFKAQTIGGYILAWVVLAVVGIVLLSQVLQAAINMVWQLKLNKNPMGFLSILAFLASLVGIVLVIILFKI